MEEAFGSVEEFEVADCLRVFELFGYPCSWGDVSDGFCCWYEFFVDWRDPPDEAAWMVEHVDEAVDPRELRLAPASAALRDFVAV